MAGVSFGAKLLVFTLVGVAVLALASFLVIANREDLSELQLQCNAAHDALKAELPGASLTCAPAEGEMGFVLVAVDLKMKPTGKSMDQTRQQVEGIVKFRVKNVLTVDLTIAGEPAMGP